MNSLSKKVNWEWKPLKYIFDYSISSVDRRIKEEEIDVNVCHYPNVYNMIQVCPNCLLHMFE